MLSHTELVSKLYLRILSEHRNKLHHAKFHKSLLHITPYGHSTASISTAPLRFTFETEIRFCNLRHSHERSPGGGHAHSTVLETFLVESPKKVYQKNNQLSKLISCACGSSFSKPTLVKTLTDNTSHCLLQAQILELSTTFSASIDLNFYISSQISYRTQRIMEFLKMTRDEFLSHINSNDTPPIDKVTTGAAIIRRSGRRKQILLLQRNDHGTYYRAYLRFRVARSMRPMPQSTTPSLEKSPRRRVSTSQASTPPSPSSHMSPKRGRPPTRERGKSFGDSQCSSAILFRLRGTARTSKSMRMSTLWLFGLIGRLCSKSRSRRT